MADGRGQGPQSQNLVPFRKLFKSIAPKVRQVQVVSPRFCPQNEFVSGADADSSGPSGQPMPSPSPSLATPEPPQPRYAVSALAHRLGVAPATLRTWARRYGLGPSLHVAGSHRRYSAADVARLEVMQRLSRDGVPPADAARVALGSPDVTPPGTPVGPR